MYHLLLTRANGLLRKETRQVAQRSMTSPMVRWWIAIHPPLAGYEFLDITTMRLLYEFWEKGEAKDGNGEELYFPKEKEALFRDLGLFLFMYLGDGQNLADTLCLEYDGWYFMGSPVVYHINTSATAWGIAVMETIAPDYKIIIERNRVFLPTLRHHIHIKGMERTIVGREKREE